MAVKIETFRVTRVQGKSENWAQLRLIKSHKDALDDIGFTGEHKGTKISVGEFLNKHVAKPNETFRVETLEQSTDKYKDKILIIKVTV